MNAGAGNPWAGASLAVIKVGSRLLVDPQGGEPHRDWLQGLAADIASLRERGLRIVLVSSGAVALGRRRLSLPAGALTLAQKQAAAAAGQSLLMRAWEEALQLVGITAAQVLLTLGDTEVRRRFLNARATLETLIGCDALPIVNENDTVATEELRYGDNDRLAARVAQMVGADLLVLLSDVDGLYTADPALDPAARHIPRLDRIEESHLSLAGGPNRAAGMGTGGMATKLAAARIAAAAGCATLIAAGAPHRPLRALEAGARHTLICADASPAAAYKAWIGGALQPRGALVVDAGAAAALAGGKSLLAAGLRRVEGEFGKGDAVLVRDEAGRELGRGLARYDAADAKAIVGLRSQAIEAALGYAAGPVVHADDLALGQSEARAQPKRP